jgi:peptidoglycan/xylan/chitin deacetylase (PgdA/CDA1 family)
MTPSPGRMFDFRSLARGRGAYQRAAARLAFQRRFIISKGQPLISFTFDDFPRSALVTGGAILHQHGLAGTYYASFGLMGTSAPTGHIFEPEDLGLLFRQGHELGCHTFAHCHSWDSTPAAFEASVIKNRETLRLLCPSRSFSSLSYPISPPRPWTKRRTGRHFACCRGGGQTFNAGPADLNYLSAYFLEKAGEDLETLTNVMEQNSRAGGWLILATHDVANDPTRYGCTPDFLDAVVQSAIQSGARILPVSQALDVLRGTRA